MATIIAGRVETPQRADDLMGELRARGAGSQDQKRESGENQAGQFDPLPGGTTHTSMPLPGSTPAVRGKVAALRTLREGLPIITDDPRLPG